MYITDLHKTEEQQVMMDAGSPGRVTVRWLLTQEQGAPNYEMRYFSLSGNAHTEWHSHPWEHEVFVIKGEGAVRMAEGLIPLRAGSAVLVPAGEMHQFKNSGPEPFDFICVVPKGTRACGMPAPSADEQELNSVERMARIMALLYYHLSKEIIDTFGDKGKEVVRRAINNFGTERGRQVREKVLAAGLEPNFENLSKFYDMPLKEAWQAEGAVTAEHYVSRITYCPFARLWREKGAEELGLLYCEQDRAMMEAFNEKVKFDRPTNMLTGAASCDFDVKIE